MVPAYKSTRQRRSASEDYCENYNSNEASTDTTWSTWSFDDVQSFESTDRELIDRMKCLVPGCGKILPFAHCGRMDILCKYHAGEHKTCPGCNRKTKKFSNSQLKLLCRFCEMLLKAGVIDKHGNLRCNRLRDLSK